MAKRGRPRKNNPSKSTLRKRKYREVNENKWDLFLTKVVNGWKKFSSPAFKK